MKLSPFGKAVRKLRISRGETQFDAANAVGVSVAFWSAIETGRKHVPEDLLRRIVAHFELSNEEAKELERLAWISRKEVTINMENLSDQNRELVVGFARKFSELNEETKRKLRNLLEQKGGLS